MDSTVALEAAPKAAVYGAVMLCVGVAAGRALLRLRVARVLTREQCSRQEDAFRRLAVRAPFILVAALAFRAWGHTAAAFGVSDSFSYQNLHLIALESQWGAGWQLRIAAALILTAVTMSIVRWPSFGWLAAGGGAVALCYVLPLLGHAEGEPVRVLLHGSHIFGAGIWVGTLAAMTMASRDLNAPQAGLPSGMSPTRRAMLSHFAPVAFTGSVLLLLTGATAAWWYVGKLSNLWTTTYGGLLLLKLLLAAGIASCGFVNWRALQVPLPSTGSPRSRRMLVGLEIALAASVVIVTAVLTETEHP